MATLLTLWFIICLALIFTLTFRLLTAFLLLAGIAALLILVGILIL